MHTCHTFTQFPQPFKLISRVRLSQALLPARHISAPGGWLLVTCHEGCGLMSWVSETSQKLSDCMEPFFSTVWQISQM